MDNKGEIKRIDNQIEKLKESIKALQKTKRLLKPKRKNK